MDWNQLFPRLSKNEMNSHPSSDLLNVSIIIIINQVLSLCTVVKLQTFFPKLNNTVM